MKLLILTLTFLAASLAHASGDLENDFNAAEAKATRQKQYQAIKQAIKDQGMEFGPFKMEEKVEHATCGINFDYPCYIHTFFVEGASFDCKIYMQGDRDEVTTEVTGAECVKN